MFGGLFSVFFWVAFDTQDLTFHLGFTFNSSFFQSGKSHVALKISCFRPSQIQQENGASWADKTVLKKLEKQVFNEDR